MSLGDHPPLGVPLQALMSTPPVSSLPLLHSLLSHGDLKVQDDKEIFKEHSRKGSKGYPTFERQSE